MAVKLLSDSHEETVPLKRLPNGFWKAKIDGIKPHTRYLYLLDGKLARPDPASHYQPKGVHGPSEVVDHSAFTWSDASWRCINLSEMVFYELHVGTFTPEGTFEAIIPRLREFSELGINALELMPISQFPSDRNWGYDGTYPYAVQNSYGGPEGLKNLVDRCHELGLAVVLDVVYNHVGPEGNYLQDFGPYFTEKYRTPWGPAINFDDAFSDEVRNFFVENAIHWFTNYHIDALRLDAVHSIFDMSATPFLRELADRVSDFCAENNTRRYLIAESDLNDSRVVKRKKQGGYGIDAQWLDDFHHALHALLTGEEHGYYVDFGGVEHLVKSIKEGFVYSGQYSRYRLRRHGNSSRGCPAYRFIAFTQNHDQVGNRMLGERLSSLVSFEALKLAAGVVFLSPYMPMIFMGEEYGEECPFFYFVSHSKQGLVEAVRRGRREEFKAFDWKGKPPDPQNPETFQRSKIKWEQRGEGDHFVLLNFYKHLIKMRKTTPSLIPSDHSKLEVYGKQAEKLLFLRRWTKDSEVFCIFNFNNKDATTPIGASKARYMKILDSSDKQWHGPGTKIPVKVDSRNTFVMKGLSFVVFIC